MTSSDGVNYYRGRNELARMLYGMQQLQLQAGQVPRQWIRIAQTVKVDLDFHSTRVQSFTVDLSLGGFGALLTAPPGQNEIVRYALHLPGATPLAGQARVLEVKFADGAHRAAFHFLPLPDPDRERLEIFIFDVVLARLA